MSRINDIYRFVRRGSFIPNFLPNGSPALPGVNNPAGMITAQYLFFSVAGVITVLEKDEKRKFLQIQNSSAVNTMKFAFDAIPDANFGITLQPGQVEIFDVAVPTGQLNVFCAAASQAINLVVGY